jgi:hypothetical protein
MTDELKDQRVVTMMTPTELEAIDDWMFKHRLKSRGEAIRRLCQIGIIAEETPLMPLAMKAMAHFMKDEPEAAALFSSGDSLTVDVARLALAVVEERSKMGGFGRDKDVLEAMKAAAHLKEAYGVRIAAADAFRKGRK